MCGLRFIMGPVRLEILLFILAAYGAWAEATKEEEDDTERLPSKCEVCKLLSMELQEALSRTGRSREVLELGQVLDTGKRKRHVPYSLSETRLEEALENLCERILDYNVHAERKGSLRYAKGQSQTMATLKGLVQKGVKVDLGIPLELWDEPSVEVTFLKKHFLCERHVLPASETACLREAWTGKEKISDGQEEADDEEEEEEEEITKTSGNPKHDPEDL